MGLDVLIADGHRLTLDGMRVALERCDDIELAGAVTSGADLLLFLKSAEPDVVLIDAGLPDMAVTKCVDLVRHNYPAIRIGVLFEDRDMPTINAALAGGAAACVMKDIDPSDLPAAIRQVVEATVFTAAPGLGAVTRELADHAPTALAELTERELTMLKAIARGLSNKAISRELWVTEQTVKFHLNNVYRKLGVPNRTAAARLAFDQGLLERHLAA